MKIPAEHTPLTSPEHPDKGISRGKDFDTPITMRCFRNGRWQVDELSNSCSNLERELNALKASKEGEQVEVRYEVQYQDSTGAWKRYETSESITIAKTVARLLTERYKMYGPFRAVEITTKVYEKF